MLAPSQSDTAGVTVVQIARVVGAFTVDVAVHLRP